MFWLSHRPNRKRDRRKVENRRVVRKGREPKKPMHVLDVQTYSSRELQIKRAAQWRTVLLSTGLILSLVALVSTGRILLNRYLFENPELTVADLEVRTDGILSTSQIVRYARIRKGESMLGLHLDTMRENLLRHPQVRNVRIEREFPGTMRIAVEERFAIAWLSCGEPSIGAYRGGGVLLDEHGVPFVCESLVREYMGLPSIDVPLLRELIPGRKIESEQVLAALELLCTSRQGLFDLNLEILAISCPNPYSMVAKYNNQSDVVFGLSDLKRQVAHFRAAVLHAQSIHKSIASINLLMSRNIPVIYSDPDAVAERQADVEAVVPQSAAGSMPLPSAAPEGGGVANAQPQPPVPVSVSANATATVGAAGEKGRRRSNQIRSILGNQ